MRASRDASDRIDTSTSSDRVSWSEGQHVDQALQDAPISLDGGDGAWDADGSAGNNDGSAETGETSTPTLEVVVSGVGRVDNWAFDEQWVYWLDSAGIRRQLKKPGAAPVLVDSVGAASRLKVDACYLYWLRPGLPEPLNGYDVMRASKSGGVPEKLVPKVDRYFEMDEQDIYVGNSSAVVARVPKSGGTPQILVSRSSDGRYRFGNPRSTGTLAAVSSQHAYFLDSHDGFYFDDEILRVPKTGGQVESYTEGPRPFFEVMIRDDWLALSTAAIAGLTSNYFVSAANLRTRGPGNVYGGYGSMGNFALDAKFLYFRHTEVPQELRSDSVIRHFVKYFPLSGGATEVLMDGADTSGLAASGGYLYFISRENIVRRKALGLALADPPGDCPTP